MPSTDFRTESATINARQRLKLRSLFQTAGVDCKPNEEIAAAGRLLTRLGDLALDASGDAPLPKRPDTQHLSELLALSGNEQLLAILDRHDALVANLNEWTAARMLAEERLPAFQRLEALARHADGLDAGDGSGAPNGSNRGRLSSARRVGPRAGARGEADRCSAERAGAVAGTS